MTTLSDEVEVQGDWSPFIVFLEYDREGSEINILVPLELLSELNELVMLITLPPTDEVIVCMDSIDVTDGAFGIEGVCEKFLPWPAGISLWRCLLGGSSW